MRKLASIQTVVRIAPIPGADAIEKATVLGWECVVKKSEGILPGDLVVYIEIDSICPPREPFLFLAERKYRVRTIKLRGQISQGLTLPLSYFPNLTRVAEGDDVTELLGITKYDPEAAREQRGHRKPVKHNPIREFFMQFRWFRALHRKLFPSAKRGWPEFIRKTDETRIQNIPAVLRDHGGRDYYVTEKLDGQSASYFYTRTVGFMGKVVSTFGVCSRNLYLKTPHSCTWWDIARAENIQQKLSAYGHNICIQGEIVGPGIQGNKYGLSSLQLYVFNAWDIDRQVYYQYDELARFCKALGFNMVPVTSDYRPLPGTVSDVVEESKGKSVLNPKIHREGLVFRTARNLPNGEPISFKAINPDFLLKYQDEEEVV